MISKNKIEYILSSYGQFLLTQSLVSPGKEKYFVFWLRRFLSNESTFKGPNWEEKLSQYLLLLGKDQNIADWQVTQAEQSVWLYFQNYLPAQKTNRESSGSSSGNNGQDGWFDKRKMIVDLEEWLRIKHYAYRTEKSYISWCKRLFKYSLEHHSSNTPDLVFVSQKLIRDFLAHIALTHNVSKSTQNQAFSAILFLCRYVLKIELHDMEKNLRSRAGKKLPVVFSPGEIKRIFSHLTGTSGLILRLIYSSGLRLNECIRLRVKDLDFDQGLLFVRSGKGDKDRSTVFAKSLRNELSLHLEKILHLHKQDLKNGYGEVYMPGGLGKKYPNACKEFAWQYVFPSRNLSLDPKTKQTRRHHISESAVQKMMKKLFDMQKYINMVPSTPFGTALLHIYCSMAPISDRSRIISATQVLRLR